VFLEIAGQYAIADSAFAAAEQRAFHEDDDSAFDRAGTARQHNDQAYFLYLFTRFEESVNAAIKALLATRLASASPWADRRIWAAWSRVPVRDIALLSKAEVLMDKGRQDYATVKEYYEGRNAIAHGGALLDQVLVPSVAQTMAELVQRFAIG
jgi:hypothetical protein